MRGRLLQLLARAGAAQAPAMVEASAWAPAQLRTCTSGVGHAQRRHASSGAAGGDDQQPQQPTEQPAAPTEQPAAPTEQPAAPTEQPAAAAAGAKTGGAAKQPAKPKAKKAPAKQPQQPQQSAEAAEPAEEPSAAVPPLLSGLPVAQLLDVPPNTYFDVPAGALPEATAAFYEDPVLKGENVHQPNYGCRSVHAEWDYSGRRSLMARECMHRLARAVQARETRQLFLDGWAGSGKSVALYSLVAWARAQGWLVLYLPSAFSLVQTGTYSRGEDGLWDTPEAARWLLASLRDAHADQLPALRTPAGRPLAEVVEEGLAPATKPADAVAAAIAAKEAVAAATELPTLIAVDDYNVLYSHTGYYESVTNHHRRQLAPGELRLAQAFRVLEQPPPAAGVVVAAPTFGQTVSPKLRLPRPRGSRLHVPRYALPEVAAAAEFFSGAVMGGEAAPPSEPELLRALFLTNGNARELREFAPALLGLGAPLLGLSRGYKAAAAQRRARDAGLLG